MGLVQHRDFSVKYTNVSEDRWVAAAELVDPQHNIVTELEITTPELIVSNARIDFRKCPLDQCREISGKAGDLTGCSVIRELSGKLDQLFSGPYGCPNVRHLFGISGPGFVYVYYPQLMREGKMKPEDWWQMVGTTLKDECIAHKRMSEAHSGSSAGRDEKNNN